MSGHGGFRHNAQVLRVVDRLERRSPDYAGLNLTREVRESLLKHEIADDWPAELEPRPRQPYLEAQVTDLADSTAYDAHDAEDGLRAGMFDEDEIASCALWRRARERVEERHRGFLASTSDRNLRIKRLVNELMKVCINDLIHGSRERIAAAGIETSDDARALREPLLRHTPAIAAEVGELQRFLYRVFYRHDHLQALTEYAARVLGALFESLCARPEEMAAWYRAWADEVGRERAVCDYLAGMTDRFAQREFQRLTGCSRDEAEPPVLARG